MTSDELAAGLRNDARPAWALIAAVAGAPKRIAMLGEALSAAEIERGTQGKAVSPSRIQEHIEALSAADLPRLAAIAEGWRRPALIGDDPWWISAWRAALPYLARSGHLDEGQADVPSLAGELALISGRAAPKDVTWDEVAAKLSSAIAKSATARQLANSRLVDKKIGADQLTRAPQAALRVLRGRAERLTADARQVLAAMADRALSADPYHAALVVELCRDAIPSKVAEVRQGFADLQRKQQIDPRQMTPIAYTLLKDGWLTP